MEGEEAQAHIQECKSPLMQQYTSEVLLMAKKKGRGGARPGAGKKAKRNPVAARKAKKVLRLKKRNKAWKQQQKFSGRMMTQNIHGEWKGNRRRYETESIVISSRGRTLKYSGDVDPLSQPAANMPQSPQDYFLLSRAIKNYAYDAKKGVLEIQFTTGAVYQFGGVPRGIWERFKDSASKGRYFHDRIYGTWTGQKGNKTYHERFREVKIK